MTKGIYPIGPTGKGELEIMSNLPLKETADLIALSWARETKDPVICSKGPKRIRIIGRNVEAFAIGPMRTPQVIRGPPFQIEDFLVYTDKRDGENYTHLVHAPNAKIGYSYLARLEEELRKKPEG